MYGQIDLGCGRYTMIMMMMMMMSITNEVDNEHILNGAVV